MPIYKVKENVSIYTILYNNVLQPGNSTFIFINLGLKISYNVAIFKMSKWSQRSTKESLSYPSLGRYMTCLV